MAIRSAEIPAPSPTGFALEKWDFGHFAEAFLINVETQRSATGIDPVDGSVPEYAFGEDHIERRCEAVGRDSPTASLRGVNPKPVIVQRPQGDLHANDFVVMRF